MERYEHRPCVYVSYSRAEEKRSGTVAKMQRDLPDIDFQIDTEKIKIRDDMMEYIDKLGSAELVVVIFSEEYFHSFYCMYELTKIMQHGGDLKKRVFAIRHSSYQLNSENNKNEILRYWSELIEIGDNKRPEKYTEIGTLEEIIKIYEELDKIFSYFSTNQSPSEKEIVEVAETIFDSSCQPIYDWLKEVIPSISLSGRSYIGDRIFCTDVEDEIYSILVQFPVLYAAIKERIDGVLDEADLAEKLCSYKKPRELISPLLIKACKRAVLKARKTQPIETVALLKDRINSLLNWLSVLTVNSDWIEKEKDNHNSILNLPVKTSFGEAVSAGRLGQVRPALDVSGKLNEINGRYELNPFKAGTWDNSKNLVIDMILRFIFNQVFKENIEKPIKKDSEVITEEERHRLNEQIKLNAEDGSRHYYCMLRISEIDKNFLSDTSLISQLKSSLPALDIFRVEDSVGNIVFIAADEVELSQAYHYFLTQLETW